MGGRGSRSVEDTRTDLAPNGTKNLPSLNCLFDTRPGLPNQVDGVNSEAALLKLNSPTVLLRDGGVPHGELHDRSTKDPLGRYVDALAKSMALTFLVLDARIASESVDEVLHGSF